MVLYHDVVVAEPPKKVVCRQGGIHHRQRGAGSDVVGTKAVVHDLLDKTVGTWPVGTFFVAEAEYFDSSTNCSVFKLYAFQN